MIVDDLRLDDQDGSCELSARVSQSKLAPGEERLWYRVPAALRPRELDASPFLAGLLVPCVWLGEPLTIDGPVSTHLLTNAERAKEVYRSWYPQLADVEVRAEAHELGAPAAAAEAGCFFTRGVDSWYSVLNGIAGARRLDPPITTLLYSPSSDFFAGGPSESQAQELRAASTALVREAAEQVGCPLVTIDSNLRALVEPHRSWGYIHAALLASMGLALGSHLGRVHIAGSLRMDSLVPQGSHPDMDLLWSTERTEIVHDGAEVTRTEKVRFLASHPVALERLKVCINLSPSANCGKCPKCVRTMLGLRLAGALDSGPAFDAPLSARRVARIVPRFNLEWALHREMGQALKGSREHRLHAAHRYATAEGGIRTLIRRARQRARIMLGPWRGP